MAAKQKSVLITGCSAGGLGAAFAEEFHRNGWLVFASARNLTKVQHLKELGCEAVELDVTKEESLQEAVKVVNLKTDGNLDMLINNAGISTRNTRKENRSFNSIVLKRNQLTYNPFSFHSNYSRCRRSNR